MQVNPSAYAAYVPQSTFVNNVAKSAEDTLLEKIQGETSRYAIDLAFLNFSVNNAKATSQGLDLYNFTAGLFGLQAQPDSLLATFDPLSSGNYLKSNSAINLLA